ncbi:GPP34 family phosphoprotein [Yinghuangia sp. ASG 101]|uniref:GPP34 family phosphoprotein n=1 Tax=Yinghuangia sp. ASG 101 TaxID=2896848 RepID=UPI001E2E7691|nr:GPP34 family phosphoprotein [Yinghuangia sp. ASG 101]UGQ12002.1 GPP34 family phosphoprotein [Yinghuangia sp. ASG 101]
MSTAQDLFALALDTAEAGDVGSGGRFIGQGEVSLALAGAELADLVAAGAADLDGDRIVPGPPGAAGAGIERAAADAVVRERPYETVEDWLWRRGRGLSAVYAEAWEAEGKSPAPHRRGPRRRAEPGGTQGGAADGEAARRRARERWEGDPVLRELAAAAGIRGLPAGEVAEPGGDALATIVAAVDDAVAELGAVRHRRGVEEAAFDNIWRVP